MSNPAPKAVYDCNVYVQALISPRGPAAACVEKARTGEVQLIVSSYVLREVREIHYKVPARYGITSEGTEKLARSLETIGTAIPNVPAIYTHPIDPDDSHYIDLAVQANARLVVSRDRHLLMLMDLARKEGREFRMLFPSLRILDPVEFLRGLTPDQA